MRVLLMVVIFFSFVKVTDAYYPIFVSPESPLDIIEITEPEISREYHGELIGFPHTYEIDTNKDFELNIQILVPDTSGSENNMAGVIVKKDSRGGVALVASLGADEASWNSVYEFYSGNSFRNGPAFKTRLDTGEYLLEIHTPDNLGKYVLTVGSIENSEKLGYLETVKQLARTKEFFGKSQITILRSPVIFTPLLIIIVVLGVAYTYYRRRTSAVVIE